MAYVKKFIRGRSVQDPNELVLLLGEGNYFMFGDHDKPYHSGWVCSMQFRKILDHLGQGTLYLAAPNPERKD